jgi:hypothetical protein
MLVSKLPYVNPANPRTFVRYQSAHDELGLTMQGNTVGKSLERQGLRTLAEWAHAEGFPAITGLIVNGEKSGEAALQPSTAYFELYRKSPLDDMNWWLDEIRKSREFDWAPYIRDELLPGQLATSEAIKPPQSSNASDFDVSAQRGQFTTYRIIRDTALARLVKMHHNYECQICGEWIDLPNGERYAEAHHVQPLGSPHDGPDRIENIVCVCPNHHAELDYFARSLDMSHLRSVEGHSVDEKYLAYHNEYARKLRED